MRASRLRPVLALLILVGVAVPVGAQSALLDSPSRSFHTGHTIVTDAYHPEHTACADMDGDGDLDLVVAQAGNVDAPKVSVLFNQGDGSYAAAVNHDAPGQTAEVVLEDFDGDGDVDAAFAQSYNGAAGSRVLYYQNFGDGSLLPYVSYTVGTGPTGIVAADVDVDGDQDLICANNFWLQEDVTVLYNNGAGVFPTRIDFPITGENPREIAAGDLNGDGAPELVVTLEDGDPAFAVLINDGFGSYSAPIFHSTGYAAFYPAGVAVADVDRDGDADVLYGTDRNGSTGYILAFALFRNDGSGTLGPVESVPVGQSFGVINDFAVDDVTGDGWPDVLGTVRNGYQGFVLVPGDGAGGFAAPMSYRAGEYSRGVTTADVDNDGDPDAIVTNSASNTITVHANDGSGFSFPPHVELGAYIEETVAGDLDLDGDIDLLTADFDGFVVLDNQGDGSFVKSEQPSSGQKIHMKLRDLDGDGDLDVIFGGVGRALNDGTGTFGPVTSFPVFSVTDDVDTLDLDNDGDLDAVVTATHLTEAGFYVLENDGAGNFGTPVFFGSPLINSTGRVVTGDFTHDGNEDVVATEWDSLWLWPGNGSGGFSAPIERTLGTAGAAYLAAGDFDEDGTLDLATSHWGSAPEGQALNVVLGNGDGTFSAATTYLAMFSRWKGGVAGLSAADVDGDGRLDLVGGARAANDVAIFLGQGDGTFAREQRYGVDGEVQWVATGDFDLDGRADVAVRLADFDDGTGGIAVLLGAESSPFVNLGFGLKGSAGVPLLRGAGAPVGGSSIGFDLSQAAPLAPFLLFISSNRIDLPLRGGTLVPAADDLIPMVTSASGDRTVSGTWPAGLPVGTRIYTQAWIRDLQAARGASASNALQVTQLE